MRFLAHFQILYYLIYLNSNIRTSFRETDNKAPKYMGKKKKNKTAKLLNLLGQRFGLHCVGCFKNAPLKKNLTL